VSPTPRPLSLPTDPLGTLLQAGGERAYGRPSFACSRRPAARASSSGEADRYQKVWERLQALVLCGTVLGLRPGELAGLLWTDLDLDGDPATVERHGLDEAPS
jgi:integrase